jgi:cytochrome c oxidase cbb3-type subunit III
VQVYGHNGHNGIVTHTRASILAATLLTLGTAALHAQFPKSVVDPAVVTRGATVYAKDCAHCHGEDGRGTAPTPDLVRSTIVLHDRREALQGKELATYLKTTPPHSFSYDDTQAAELSQYLSQNINKILRSGYDSTPQQMLSGDATAGQAYFNGAGGCAKCHSATGDLAGIGKKYAPAVLQQRFLFPASVVGTKLKPVVTVTIAGTKTSGELVRIDDFTVAIRDQNGALKSYNRTPGTSVTMVDPYAGHVDLLDHYTDSDIHNLTTYLDTLR